MNHRYPKITRLDKVKMFKELDHEEREERSLRYNESEIEMLALINAHKPVPGAAYSLLRENGFTGLEIQKFLKKRHKIQVKSIGETLN